MLTALASLAAAAGGTELSGNSADPTGQNKNGRQNSPHYTPPVLDPPGIRTGIRTSVPYAQSRLAVFRGMPHLSRVRNTGDEPPR